MTLHLPGLPAGEADVSTMVRAFDLGPALVTVVSLAGEPWQARVQTEDGDTTWLPWEEVERRLAVDRAYRLATAAGLALERVQGQGWDLEVTGPSSYGRVVVWVKERVPGSRRRWLEAGVPPDVEPLVVRQGRQINGRWRNATDDTKVRRRLAEALARSYLRNAGGSVCMAELREVVSCHGRARKWVRTEASPKRRRVVLSDGAQTLFAFPGPLTWADAEWTRRE